MTHVMVVCGRQVPLGAMELSVLEAGSGGRPMMWIHGFAGGKEDYAGHFRGFAVDGFHVVAPDLRGHGASSAPDKESDYDFAILANDLLDLADALEWESFVLLGHSMGGMVAQELALIAPQRLKALVLVDTCGGALEVDRGPALAAVELVRQAGTERLAVLMQSISGGPLESEATRALSEHEPGWIERGDANLRNSSDAMYAAMLSAMLDRADRRAELSSLQVPTLVMVGDQDVVFIKSCEELGAAIPNAQLVMVPESGHTPMQEAPQAWAEALTAFLNSIE